MNVIVSVSDAKVSVDPGDVIATYSLRSCIGVSLYDPVSNVGGMLHFQLPTSTLDPVRAKQRPLMFADTGMECLIRELEARGAQKRRLKVKLAGAAQILDDHNLFNIGRRNHASIRKILWQHGMFVDGEDIGGSTPRNMYLSIADGMVTVKAQGTSINL
ncbi:MAG: chemotaxis protein CheD [Tepidisphaeraceae bacterium]